MKTIHCLLFLSLAVFQGASAGSTSSDDSDDLNCDLGEFLENFLTATNAGPDEFDQAAFDNVFESSFVMTPSMRASRVNGENGFDMAENIKNSENTRAVTISNARMIADATYIEGMITPSITNIQSRIVFVLDNDCKISYMGVSSHSCEGACEDINARCDDFSCQSPGL